MRIHVSNCDVDYHAGCAAVAQSIRTILETGGFSVGVMARHVPLDALSPGDLLLCNGEGTMHGNQRRAHLLLNELQAARRLGCRVHLINSVWQNMTSEAGRQLSVLDGVTVREPLSRMEMQGFCDPQVCPDLAYYCPLRVTTGIDYAGEPLVGDFFFDRHAEVLPGYPRLSLTAADWSQLVASIGTASVYVTGRHHGVYAACRARTPFVFHRANTHKVIGLIAWSGVPLPVCPDLAGLADVVNWALRHRSVYERFFDWLDQRRPWTPDALGS